MGLEKHDEDFGQTLGYWGVTDGPYLVLPFFGPSNFRDGVGRFADYYADLITYVDPTRDRNILWGTRVIARRAELLGASRVLEAAALDPYAFVRDAYLQRRRNLVYDGKPPPEADEEEDTPSKPAPGKDDGKSKPAPRTERRSPAAMTHFGADESIRSVLVSGEPLTPAQEEALAVAQRASPR
jgi:phospholipid-binding lipoprotein MlaA